MTARSISSVPSSDVANRTVADRSPAATANAFPRSAASSEGSVLLAWYPTVTDSVKPRVSARANTMSSPSRTASGRAVIVAVGGPSSSVTARSALATRVWPCRASRVRVRGGAKVSSSARRRVAVTLVASAASTTVSPEPANHGVSPSRLPPTCRTTV